MLCPRKGSTVLLSVYLPHNGRDEGDHIKTLVTVSATLHGLSAKELQGFSGLQEKT